MQPSLETPCTRFGKGRSLCQEHLPCADCLRVSRCSCNRACGINIRGLPFAARSGQDCDCLGCSATLCEGEFQTSARLFVECHDVGSPDGSIQFIRQTLLTNHHCIHT